MKKRIIAFLSLFLLIIINNAYANNITTEKSPVAVIKSMFRYVSEARDINQFDRYYAKNFVLVSNLKSYDYSVYKNQQAQIFKSLKSLKIVKYNDIFSDGNKVAGRVEIKLVKNDGTSYLFHVIFIADVERGKITRIWEMTKPNMGKKIVTIQPGRRHPGI